jgi:hypothetical protein
MKILRPWSLVAFLISSALILPAAPSAVAQEPGTLGMTVQQLYMPREASHRGNLVVLDVQPKYPAAEAGIHPGDIITEVNGMPVIGRDLAEIRLRELSGPVGGSVKLKTGRVSGGEMRDVSLVRRVYIPYENPASDPFHYTGPGNWRSERHEFPLEWAPSIGYQGLADLLFTPGFNDENSPEFFSYIGFWWIDGKPRINATQLEKDLLAYYHGLSDDFTKDAKVNADLNRVSVSLKAEADSSGEVLRGDITTYSMGGKLITLHTDAAVRPCAQSDHTVIFFILTPQDRSQPVWKQMKAVGDSFRCKP